MHNYHAMIGSVNTGLASEFEWTLLGFVKATTGLDTYYHTGAFASCVRATKSHVTVVNWKVEKKDLKTNQKRLVSSANYAFSQTQASSLCPFCSSASLLLIHLLLPDCCCRFHKVFAAWNLQLPVSGHPPHLSSSHWNHEHVSVVWEEEMIGQFGKGVIWKYVKHCIVGLDWASKYPRFSMVWGSNLQWAHLQVENKNAVSWFWWEAHLHSDFARAKLQIYPIPPMTTVCWEYTTKWANQFWAFS